MGFNECLTLFLLVGTASSASLSGLLFLALLTTSATATEWRREGEVNVLLRVDAHEEGGNVHHLVANTGEEKKVRRR